MTLNTMALTTLLMIKLSWAWRLNLNPLGMPDDAVQVRANAFVSSFYYYSIRCRLALSR